MITPLENYPASINSRLAEYLHDRKESIISEWMERVQIDADIRSAETLNAIALKNHMPVIFDDLTDTLNRYGNTTVAEQAVNDAGNHGAARFHQGYELPEMLREIKHFRAIIVYHLRVFGDLYDEDGVAARVFISTTVHSFIDDLAIDATQEYLASQLSL